MGGHMDGHGWGEAANDDGSGAALVMELARVFSSPDVQTDRSIRFVLWNNEETGTNGARAYVAQRQALQGKENPAGSGKYPEPKWLGMIQHDMMLFDHGMPRPDGTMSPEQRPEADVNIEFAMTSKLSEGAQKLAWAMATANDKYATDYPAQVGQHMTNTDSGPFQDIIPAISLREDERGRADRQRLGSAVAPADRPVLDVQRQGFPSRSERRADHAECGGDAERSEAEEVSAHADRGMRGGVCWPPRMRSARKPRCRLRAANGPRTDMTRSAADTRRSIKSRART